MLEDFAEGFNRLGIFCALIAGLGRAALSLNRPSWRLASMDNDVAAGLRYFSPLLAGPALAFGTVELINNVVSASLAATIFGNGPVAGLIGMVLLAAAARPAHSSPSGTAGRAPKNARWSAGWCTSSPRSVRW